jgi:uncharacterized Zn-binding protein involved in type VI secretion
MGKPAARVGDPVNHTLPPLLTGGPGSTNVLIGGKPAWRAVPAAVAASLTAAKSTSDAGIQTAESATLAATGTPGQGAAMAAVTNGSTTVLINGFPAAREGDSILEAVGPANKIAMGCPNVQIGG